ncbi:MAG: hypothetical protein Q4B17_11835 [Lautropia sp.]|nr:hypothetical protein [Lautropia sp.]
MTGDHPSRQPALITPPRARQTRPEGRTRRRRAPLAALLALMFSLGHLPAADAVSPPKGWERQPQSGFVVYTPRGIGQRVFMVLALTPLPAEGKSLDAWGAAMAENLSPRYGKITKREPATHAPPLWSVTHHLKAQNGQPLFATYTARPMQDGRIRMTVLVGDPALADTHATTGAKLMAEILSEDPDASTRQAEQFLKARGRSNLKFGGEFVFGRYRCQVENGRHPFTVDFDLYPNLEYRSSRKEHKTGKFLYDPAKSTVSIESSYYLTNFQLKGHADTRKIAVYFRDAAGKPWIYGEDISRERATVCEYQGKSTTPSPEQEAADKAEARRFKWVTAPGKGVPLRDIEAIIHHAEHRNDSLGVRLEEEHVLLLEDGWAYTGLRVSPADLDVKASRQHEPDQWHRWRKKGRSYQLERAGQWRDIPGIAARPARSGEKLHGAYSHAAMYGNIYTTAHTFKSTLYFKRDGTMSRGSSMRGGTTAMNTGTFSANVASDAEDNRPVKYRLDGYTLIRERADGKTTRSLAFFWGDGQEHLNIDGTTYSLSK